MNNFLRSMMNAINQNIAKPTIKYIKTPIGKIILFNSILFVHLISCRLFGMLRGCHRNFLFSILPLRGTIFKTIDSTLHLPMLFLICRPCILVLMVLSRNQHACLALYRQQNTYGTRAQICLAALFDRGHCWFSCYELFNALRHFPYS